MPIRFAAGACFALLCVLAQACSGTPSLPGNALHANARAAVRTPVLVRLHRRNVTEAYRFVKVSIGGSKPLALLLDTGSSGLRVFSNAVGKGAARTPFGIDADFHKHHWLGPLSTADVKIDGIDFGTIDIQEVENILCNPGVRCTTPAEFESEGFYGIFGVNEAPLGYPGVWRSPQPSAPPASNPGTLIYNVLVQAPAPLNNGYRVSFPSDTLQIGLQLPTDLIGYSVKTMPTGSPHPNGTTSFRATNFATCWSIAGYTTGQSCWYSGPDSGGGTSILRNPDKPPGWVFSQGSFLPSLAVRVAFTDVNPPLVWAFKTGTTDGRNTITWSNNPCYDTDLATDPYHFFDFVYDTKNARLGIRPAANTHLGTPMPSPPPPVPCAPAPK